MRFICKSADESKPIKYRGFLFAILLLVPASSFAKTIDVAILTVLKPQKILLTLHYPATAALLLHSGESTETFVLSGGRAAVLQHSEGKLRLNDQSATLDSVSLVCLNGCRLELAVPGALRRVYAGNFDFTVVDNTINVVLTLSVETFAASVLASEMAEFRSSEAMKAYAVAVRSFALSGRRHPDRQADVCDTTHCQVYQAFAPNHVQIQAVEETAGLILAYRGSVLQTFYSRSCGGKTAAFEEVWPGEAPIYPYQPVTCPVCSKENSGWKTTLNAQQFSAIDASASKEKVRIMTGRNFGWNLILSNDFAIEQVNDLFVFRGKGRGHRVGLCVAGASALANSGNSYWQILNFYFPNTEIRSSGLGSWRNARSSYRQLP